MCGIIATARCSSSGGTYIAVHCSTDDFSGVVEHNAADGATLSSVPLRLLTVVSPLLVEIARAFQARVLLKELISTIRIFLLLHPPYHIPGMHAPARRGLFHNRPNSPVAFECAHFVISHKLQEFLANTLDQNEILHYYHHVVSILAQAAFCTHCNREAALGFSELERVSRESCRSFLIEVFYGACE